MGLAPQVASLMRDVADRAIMPRYRALAAHEIVEKSPGEVVTLADREAEDMLSEGLSGLGLGARIVGEEATADDPELIDGIDKGLLWLVDPLDGTSNFAGGRGPFGMMVALVENGDTVAAWMLDPMTGSLCHAQRGFGAWIDGRRAFARESGQLRPIASLATQFMGASQRERLHRAMERRFSLQAIPRCAAAHYPIVVSGRNDVAMFQRILPWDHAPGVLFLEEAGGHARHWDGSAYKLGSARPGLLVAASERLWASAAPCLAGLLDEASREPALAA